MKSWAILSLGLILITVWSWLVAMLRHAADNVFVGASLILVWIAGVLAVYEGADRAAKAEEEERLGSLPSAIKHWKRLRKIFKDSSPTKHRRGGEVMPRPVIITNLADADRDYFKDDDADPGYRRPYRQHPDVEEVERFMGSEHPLEYLASCLTRQEPALTEPVTLTPAANKTERPRGRIVRARSFSR